ncbi:MAG: polyhydroxyalkanoate biosynthesis repressor PhaR [Microcystis aeruginosa BS13-02]|nr:polyhydroxyalkanoate biosynthesis repressor PhaR [Microcystis aeruginosa BS13-02]
MSNETVTYSLDVVLKEIKVLDEKIEGIDNRLISVEGTQKNQVWTLIILLGSAIITAGWKVFFSSNI